MAGSDGALAPVVCCPVGVAGEGAELEGEIMDMAERFDVIQMWLIGSHNLQILLLLSRNPSVTQLDWTNNKAVTS